LLSLLDELFKFNPKIGHRPKFGESDSELMAEIINLLAEEKMWVQAITGLLTFGVMKYIVVPLLKDLNDARKAYFVKRPSSQNQARPSPPENQPGDSSPSFVIFISFGQQQVNPKVGFNIR
jgi:hypothetical protein